MTVLQASDYPKFKSIPRLHRRVVLTEKIDGTNGLIDVIDNTPEGTVGATSVIGQDASGADVKAIDGASIHGTDAKTGNRYLIRPGSHNRWLTPDNDNFGFGRWVWDHADELAELGPGRHYGEWFGKGIQSGYGLDEKRFALFNTSRWYDPKDLRTSDADYQNVFTKAMPCPDPVTVVPVVRVADGKRLNGAITDALNTLELEGSIIAPGFMKPEGVVVYHEAAGTYFKVTLKNDESPKSLVGAYS